MRRARRSGGLFTCAAHYPIFARRVLPFLSLIATRTGVAAQPQNLGALYPRLPNQQSDPAAREDLFAHPNVGHDVVDDHIFRKFLVVARRATSDCNWRYDPHCSLQNRTSASLTTTVYHLAIEFGCLTSGTLPRE